MPEYKYFKRCTLFCFYIKSQPYENHNVPTSVVPYSASTSNHNPVRGDDVLDDVVPYSASTSNHNLGTIMC